MVVPTDPTSLTPTAVSCSQVDLTWNDADLEEGYYVYQYGISPPIADLGEDVTSFSVTGLSPSTTYFFSISAYDSVVEKFNTSPSGWQSATTALLLGEAARLEQVDDPATVSEEQLAPLVEEAIRRWAETGIDPRVVARLEQTEVRVEALAPDYLGLAYSDSGVIVLDDDASGRGWYIDSTPEDDVEFSEVSPHGEMIALADGPAADAVDLLTAVMHEMGHLLGFGHEGGHYTMSETLEAEVCRLPHTHDAEPIYDLDSAGGLGGFVHRLSEPVPARDGSGRSVVAWRLESEDELLWAIYRPDVGQRLGLADPAAALDAVMADWGLAN